MGRLGHLADELKRRKVIRAGVAYAVVAWLVIQVAEATFGPLRLPEWSQTLVVALALLGFPVTLALAWALELTPRGLQRERVPETPPTAPAEAPAADATADTAPPSIAVLPFTDMSPESDQGYFCDGVAEEILNSLTRVRGLQVAARTSSFQFRQGGDIPEIARRLRVATVLEGSVRKSGGRLRVTAQLIEAQSGFHLWSERFDGDTAEVFAMQERIAESVAQALELSLRPEDRARMHVGQTRDLEAYDYYLRGLSHLHAFSWRSMDYARQMFRDALRIDPDFGRAWAGLAYAACYTYMFRAAEQVYLDEAVEASEKAVTGCPQCAEGHAARGMVLHIQKRNEEAEAEFRRALDMDARLYEAWWLYGRAEFALGRYEEAARLWVQAAEVNPAEYQASSMVPMAYRALGRVDEEREWSRRALERTLRQLERHPDDVRALYLAAGNYARGGDAAHALECVERALALEPDEGPVLYNCACTLVELGDHERAMDLLERAQLPRMANRAWVERDTDLAPLKGNPRFEALLEQLPP